MSAPQYVETTMEDWARSEKYHNAHLIVPDSALIHAVETSRQHGLPEIAVSEAQGKFLHLLARSIRAERILEVGTLGGYSTIWLGRALPKSGSLTTLEISEERAEVARGNIAFAGLADRVNVLVGPASETLATLQPTPAPYDFAFIDADKVGNLDYFKEAKRLVRSGGVIIVDNVVRYGRVSDPNVISDANVEGVRRLLEYIQEDITVDCTTLATVGEKSFDGFLYAIRL